MPRLFDEFAKTDPEIRTEYQLVICDHVHQLAVDWSNTSESFSTIPNMMPPFKKMFIEAAFEKIRYGAAVFTIPIGNLKALKDITQQRFREMGVDRLVHFITYVNIRGNVSIHQLGIYIIAINAAGMYINSGDSSKFIWGHKPSDIETQRDSQFVAQQCAFFIGLMNSRNVELVDSPPPMKAYKNYNSKSGIPMLSYKTLKISPPTLKHYQQEIEAQRKSTAEREIPLHLVRGHFKDYRDGKGLFGRVKDVIWFQEQWRGKPENGIALKDYELHPPKAEHQE